jgi:ABC-type transporter Mla MlaB component
MTTRRPPFERHDAILLIANAADGARPAGLCESARVILAEPDTDLLVCDVNALVRPDVGTVDALARVTLVAKHLGAQVLLLDAAPALRELLDLAGLADVVPCVESSGREPGR